MIFLNSSSPVSYSVSFPTRPALRFPRLAVRSLLIIGWSFSWVKSYSYNSVFFFLNDQLCICNCQDIWQTNSRRFWIKNLTRGPPTLTICLAKESSSHDNCNVAHKFHHNISDCYTKRHQTCIEQNKIKCALYIKYLYIHGVMVYQIPTFRFGLQAILRKVPLVAIKWHWAQPDEINTIDILLVCWVPHSSRLFSIGSLCP